MEKRFEIFTTQIAKINRAIKKIKSEEMKEYNLKTPHVSCLHYLFKQNRPLTAKELCDACDEDKAAISRTIEFLEKNEYVVCDSNKEKRYKTPISLTEKGKKIGEVISSKIDYIIGIASTGLTEEDRTVFYKGLMLISSNLQNITSKY